MWAIVPVNGEDVFQVVVKSVQDVGSGCLLYVCVFVYCVHVSSPDLSCPLAQWVASL